MPASRCTPPRILPTPRARRSRPSMATEWCCCRRVHRVSAPIATTPNAVVISRHLRASILKRSRRSAGLASRVRFTDVERLRRTLAASVRRNRNEKAADPVLDAGVVAGIPTAFAKMQAKPVEWTLGKQAFSGVLVYDDASSAKRPGLLMVPDWKGVTDAATATAEKIAATQYVVLVVDMYGKGVRPKDDAEAMAQVKQLYADRSVLAA